MWGRASQTALAVIAIVLLHPVSPLIPKETLGSFVVSGRAFPAIDRRSPAAPAPRGVHRPTSQSYGRMVSYRFVPPADRSAVIVGINHAQGAPDLPGSVRDAKNLNAALLDYGFRAENITLLLDGNATRPAILSAVHAMAERTPTTGIAVFAIATHTRRSHGRNELATAEGARISARELASRLGEIRSRTWIALPTCYAGGYAIPGIVGRNRIATFASSADQKSYQAGNAGSFLFIHMVRRAMLERRAPFSVESAFAFAHDELEREHPDQIPSMSDGVTDDLVLGPIPRDTERADEDSAPPSRPYRSWTYSTYQAEESAPSPTPRAYRRRGPAAVCGNIRYNCQP